MHKSRLPFFLVLLSFSVRCAAQTASGAVTASDDEATRAARMRQETQASRQEAETSRDREYAECAGKILVNACKQSATERFVAKIKEVRAQEIELNTLERTLKTREVAERKATNKVHAAETETAYASAPADSVGKTHPLSKGQPSSPATPRHSQSAPPAPSAAASAARAAEVARKRVEVEKVRTDKASAAAKRAEQARKDAARYDAKVKEHAAKMAERAARQSAAVAASGPN